MRTKILVLSAALILSANLRAQVTIGELAEPSPGTLLDLNKAVKGGLILSNVKLEKLYEIPASFPGMTVNPDVTVKGNFTGAMVYHTGENNIPAGIYVWNGTNWAPAEENCAPLTADNLTLAIPFIAPLNKDLRFSAVVNTSAICSGGETYEWYKNSGGSTAYEATPFATTANATARFTTAAAYKIKVVMTNRYSDPAAPPAEKEKTVYVSPDGDPEQHQINPTYGFFGKTCLDVLKSKQPSTQTDAAFAVREDAFSGGYVKTYKFIHANSYSDLYFYYDDDENTSVIDYIVPPAASGNGKGEAAFTVAFKPNIKNLVPTNGDSLTVHLMATYRDSTGVDKMAYLEIRVEDGTCVCPAKISATKWLNFACHNLGGEDILHSYQLITRTHHGDWYRWGAKDPSVRNLDATTDAAPAGWNFESTSGATPPYTPFYQDYPTYGTAAWRTAYDPCPAGWRLPDIDELAGAIGYSRPNTSSNFSTVLPGYTSAYLRGTFAADPDNFSALIKIDKHLNLPAAGKRDSANGAMNSRGHNGNYWSSSASPSYNSSWMMTFSPQGVMNSLSTYDRAMAHSVRCVSAE